MVRWVVGPVPLFVSNRALNTACLAGNVLLEAESTGLPQDSVAVPLALELVDRSWLSERAGHLSPSLVYALDLGIRTVLAL